MNGFNDRCLDVNVDSNTSAGVILVQRREKWANIAQTLDQRLVFTRDRLSINQIINQSNKTSIASISSADRAQRRTNP